MSFTFTPTALPEVVLIEPACFEDPRGFFMESYNARDFARGGIDVTFAQDSHSRSAHRVLRGLHYQGEPATMGKLVRCTAGRGRSANSASSSGAPRSRVVQ